MADLDFTITGQEIIDMIRQHDLLVSYDHEFASSEFHAISFNSKEVAEKTLFICKGSTFKPAYLADAVTRGATAYVAEKDFQTSVPKMIVTNVQRAMGWIANAFYRYDASDFDLIGVTGTKGKSTTIYFIKNAIAEATAKEPAFLTTVDMYDGRSYNEAKLTTPESPTTYALFAQARQNGCKHIVMELSSQSDKVDRLVGMTYQYGVFVNISDDHIAPNEHHDFAEYLQCKMNIVARYENAVINLDDAHAPDALAAAKNAKKICTYALNEDSGADVYAKDICRDGRKTHFTAVTPDWEQPMTISIPGVYNVSNALAACAISYLLKLDPEKTAVGIEKTQVDGRMEIYEHNGYIAVVDYAHNKASIHAAFQALKDYYPDRRIRVLFGCPGEKAFQRRRDMVEESALFCDYIYISSEDPSHVDPMTICREIQGYADEKGIASEIIVDRATAVEKAVKDLKQDEILIIAGKGSEHYQVINGIAEPYAGDTVLAKEYISIK